MLVSEFDYDLPAELIAQHPAPERSASRLLHLSSSGSIEDPKMSHLPALVDRSDALVLNDTRVIKARLAGRKASGGRIELFLERLVGPRAALGRGRAGAAPGARRPDRALRRAHRRAARGLGARPREPSARGGLGACRRWRASRERHFA